MRGQRVLGLAIVAIVLLALILPLAPARAQGPALYPDLVTPAPKGMRISRELLNGSYHYLLRFDNTVVNQGGRLELTANLATSREIYQNVYDRAVGGTRVVRTRITSDLIFHPQHNHFHVEGVASYEILQKNSTGRYLSTPYRGTKTSFCIIDYVRVSSTARTTPEYQYCNASMQGLSAGWGDLYYSSLPDQWVDLGTTMPADGDYALQSIANPQRKIKETNYTNNTGVTYFTIRNGGLVTSGQSPECVATPSTVRVGDTVQVSCTRITSGTTVDFRWGSTGGPLLQTVVSSGEHKALGSVVIPQAATGAHPIFAIVRSSGSYYGAIVNVGASLTVSPTSVTPGAQVQYQARGFTGGETVSIRVDGVQVTTKAAGLDGLASGTFSMPASARGPHTVSAVGLSSNASASAQITTGQLLTLNPTFAHTETAVNPVLRGFQANELVDLSIQGGSVLKTAQVNGSGSADGAATTFTLPATVTPGTVTVVAAGRTSGSQSTASLLVLAPGQNTPTATSVPSSTATSVPQVDTRRVTTALNMRSGPGTSYSIIQVLPTNTMVTVTGPGQNSAGTIFVPIRLQSGTTGWVAERYLQATVPTPTRTPTRTPTAVGSTTPTVPASATATTTVITMEVTQRLNLRTGPGTSYSVREILPVGTVLTVTGSSQTANGYVWLPVRKSNGVTGWVASEYLRAVAAPPLPVETIQVAVEVSPTSTAIPPTATTASTSPVATMTSTAAAQGPVRLDDAVLRWLPEIEAASQSTGLAPEVIAGVIRATSGGDPNVTGENGSAGLLHVSPQEFASLGIGSGWHDPATNVAAGSAVLLSLLNSTGSVPAALEAYFGSGCTAAGYCGSNFAADVAQWAAVYAPAISAPLASGYAVLPSGWTAPAVAPYVVSGELRPVEAAEPVQATAPAEPTATATAEIVEEPEPTPTEELPIEEPEDSGTPEI